MQPAINPVDMSVITLIATALIGVSQVTWGGTLLAKIAGLPEAAQRKILGENAVRFYGLSTSGLAPDRQPDGVNA